MDVLEREGYRRPQPEMHGGTRARSGSVARTSEAKRKGKRRAVRGRTRSPRRRPLSIPQHPPPLPHPSQITPLISALMDNNLSELQRLIDGGADVNEKAKTNQTVRGARDQNRRVASSTNHEGPTTFPLAPPAHHPNAPNSIPITIRCRCSLRPRPKLHGPLSMPEHR